MLLSPLASQKPPQKLNFTYYKNKRRFHFKVLLINGNTLLENIIGML